MEQFIQYLYEYRAGQPERNVGFIRVNPGKDRTVIQIHGKGLQLGRQSELQLYIFYLENETPVGIYQGTIGNINPAINYRLTYTAEDTGIPENYPRIQGLLLDFEGKRRFAADWSGQQVQIEQMRVWEPERMENPEPEPEKQSENPEEEVAVEPETPIRAEPIAEFPQEEVPSESEDRVERYITPSRLQYKKIHRQDLAMLPRCEWRLANNSFLLHGCYNYHHLVLIDDGEDLWLGVPGIYHQKEAKAAAAFGFADFVRIEEGELELSADEREDTEAFGYWCRKVHRGNRRLL